MSTPSPFWSAVYLPAQNRIVLAIRARAAA